MASKRTNKTKKTQNKKNIVRLLISPGPVGVHTEADEVLMEVLKQEFE